eukprot:GHVP01040524.1.p1 GENE.GHVP01040524.1~~GHVP01040524.1.p1  ORF type:complete len:371 (+),score=65.45 GHVP01040524.1:26-1138(+)
MTTLQKISEIEAEMARTQKNKATNQHLGILKAKLAKLKGSLMESAGKGGGGGSNDGFDVSKTGDARIGLIGFPSVGKSTLMTVMTGTFSEVADYEFTTLTCVPGVFKYKGASIQLLDLPGIIEGAKDGKGRGKQVIGVARTCGLILIVLDVMKPMVHKRIIERELEGFGIRINRSPPEIKWKRKEKGGIVIMSTVEMTHLDEELVKSICHEYKISNAEFSFRCNATADDLIDAIEGNRIYVPAIFVLNKIDQTTVEDLTVLSQFPHYVMISAQHKWGLDDLVEKIWQYLNLTRVYTKPKSQIPDYEAPIVLRKDRPTVGDFCLKIHKNMITNFKYALVWGRSVRASPWKVGKDHVLLDEDVVQIIKKVGA